MKKSRVYTKTGDMGTTSLVGGKRVPKSHIRLEAYGTVDELNSLAGFLLCRIEDKNTQEVLSFIQNKLFAVGSSLATEAETTPLNRASIIGGDDIAKLEYEIDRIDSELPPLNNFVLPGGNEAAARAHLCRSVCRRAERSIYRLFEEYEIDNQVLKFINRLSDYFFVLARQEANKTGNEIFWNNTCK
jgi:cob(I)alamin adenosyltransferase